ncbi:MAG TPA: hypothetical protein VFR37_15785, partial [Longimicrobium sp.]|nr:hypothetical protein [Longimicrobium sp.]
MATVDSLPFLRRITGFVQSRVEGVPGFIATLISPHVAVAPRAALPDPDPADGAYRFAMLVRSEVVSFPLTLAAADDLIVAFRVDEPSPFHVEIPPSTLNPSEPRSTEATTVLQDASAGVLRPVPASVSVVDTREGLRLQVHIASEGELQRVLGAPIAAGDAVIGIVGRIDRDSPLAIPSSLIRESVAVQATLRSAPPSTGEFSRTAWLAVERADAMRRQQNLSEVHMDHLLAGLVVVGGEVADRLLSQLGTDREGALQLVESTADLSLPREYAVAPLKMLPALSKHAGEAIQAAAILARDRGSARIERSDLLLGALSITRC